MIKSMFYQFLLNRDISSNGKKLISDLKNQEITESFLKYLFEVSIATNLDIINLSYGDYSIELEIDYVGNTVEITFQSEIKRDYSAERILEDLITKIFNGFIVCCFHQWINDSWGVYNV